VWIDVQLGLLLKEGLIKKNVSNCFRKTQEFSPNSISLPVENVQPDPALSGLAETGNLYFSSSIQDL
jgi:hypothetical protein